MYPNSPNRGWNSLSRTQQIVVIVVGALVLYALLSGASSIGRLGDPNWIIAVAAIVFIAFPVHEMAHAAMAVASGLAVVGVRVIVAVPLPTVVE